MRFLILANFLKIEVALFEIKVDRFQNHDQLFNDKAQLIKVVLFMITTFFINHDHIFNNLSTLF